MNLQTMEFSASKLRNFIVFNQESDVNFLLASGFDPNFKGGWAIRLAARYGRFPLVKLFVQHGANPTLLGASGASALQLAVLSGKYWETDEWSFLLSFCDSSQLADGAAVAIIFKNIPALKRILETGRCNLNISTTLTGKTVENLAKGSKLQDMLNLSNPKSNPSNVTPNCSPRMFRQSRSDSSMNVTPHISQRNLSPSVARFFNQSASQPSLTSPPPLLQPGYTSATFSKNQTPQRPWQYTKLQNNISN